MRRAIAPTWRRTLPACTPHGMRSFAVAAPWKSELPAPSDECWVKMGTAVAEAAQQLDSGPEAFEECLTVRRQLDTVVKGCGFDNLSVSIFGGMVSNRLLETGGDVDFVAVSECAMDFEEASASVSKLGREMRRVGLRATSLPRARVPVVKVDRVSSALPGSPLHSMATSAVFQLIAPASPEDQATFDETLRRDFGATSVEWSRGQQLATATFQDTESAVRALANVHKVGSTMIPLRLPLEPKLGPELFRFPFDLCLQSSGLQNSHLLATYLDKWEYSRHLMLLAKRWGRSSGVINSIDGLLASYAVSILVIHYLVRIGKIPPLDVALTQEPQFLPSAPTYKPLASATGADASELGYIAAGFFEYYATVFDPSTDVAATTSKIVQKETLRWAKRANPDGVQRPPHHFLCIKDPYNTENIGRNLDAAAAQYVRKAFQEAHGKVREELSDPAYLVSMLSASAPRPSTGSSADDVRGSVGGAAGSGGAGGAAADEVQDDARRMLKKMEFHARKASIQRIGEATVKRNSQVRAAQDLTRSIVTWIRGRNEQTSSNGNRRGPRNNQNRRPLL